MNKKIYILVGMATILLFVGTGCIDKKETSRVPNKPVIQTTQPENVQEEKTSVIETIKPTPAKTEADPIIQNPTKATSTSPVATKPEITKCTSLDCFAKLARTCTIGEITHSYSTPFPFSSDLRIILNGKTYFKINGKNTNGSCTLIQQFNRPTATLSKEEKQKALEMGKTENEISTQINGMNESFKNNPVTVMTCEGSGPDIATYLINLEHSGSDESCSSSLGEDESHCIISPNLTCITKTL
jgi:hypothetical protein